MAADSSTGLDTLKTDLTASRDKLKGEIDRLTGVLSQVESLIASLSPEPEPEPVKKPAAKKAPRKRRAPQMKRPASRKRGDITSAVQAFLDRQSGAVHAMEILKHLDDLGLAPASAKPMPSLQSTLQRLRQRGILENTGRNRWRIVKTPEPPKQPDQPVPTSTQAGSSTSPTPPPAPAPRPATPPAAPPRPNPPGLHQPSSTTSFGQGR